MTGWQSSGSAQAWTPPTDEGSWAPGHDRRPPQAPLRPVVVWAAAAAALVAAVLIVVFAATGALTHPIADLGMRREDASVVVALFCTSTVAALVGGAAALLSGHGARLLSISGGATVVLGGGALLGAVLVGVDDVILPIAGVLLILAGVLVATLPETRSATWWVITSERRSAERVIAGLTGPGAGPARVAGRGWGSLAASAGVVVGVVMLMTVVVASVMPTTASAPQAVSLGEAGPIPVEVGDHEWEADLAVLAEDCAAGDLSSCDDLFLTSDSHGRYEKYGSTCGGRATRGYAGDCADQFD